MPFHFRRAVAVSTLVLALAAAPIVAAGAANAATADGAIAAATSTPSAVAPTEAPTAVAAVPDAPSAVHPTVTVDPIADITADRAKPEQLVKFTGHVTGLPEQASRYSIMFRSSDDDIISGNRLSPDGEFQGNTRVQVGTHWVEAVLRETFTDAEWVSNRVTFEVKPDPRTATKTTLIMPANPVAKAEYPYVVKVDPSGGSTGRVDLYEFDNAGLLYRIGFGYLDNGQTTIYAATMAGQRRVIAEFAGDNRFSGSGTGANVFVPVAPAPTTEPTNAPVSDSTSDSAEQTTATARATASAPRGQLAYTGQNPWPVLGAGAVMVAAGVLLSAAPRRRHRL